MRTCLLAMAKNEDEYIQEWIDYHLKIGFDEIFVIQDHWKANIRDDVRVHLLDCTYDESTPCDAKQDRVYADFVAEHNNEYDWIAVIDIDEFIVLKQHSNIKDFLSDKNDIPCVSLHWRFFGDNNLLDTSDGYSLIDRFTKSQSGCDNTFKTMYNMNRLREILGEDVMSSKRIVSIHSMKNIEVNGVNLTKLHFGADGKTHVYLDCEKCDKNELSEAKDIAYIAHYRKTFDEFRKRHSNPSQVWWKNFNKANGDDMRVIFDKLCPRWFNECENLDVYNFFHDRR